MTDFFHGPAPVLPSPIDGPDFNAPVDALPAPIDGPDFNAPVDALPSPGFRTFDSLTNVEFADDKLTNFQTNAVRRTPQIKSGTEGDDIITAEGGYNMFFGDGGNDIIIGGWSDDYISGGKGHDQITGGEGRDTFVIESGSGFDMIMDFVDGEDQLVFFDSNGSQITELEITNVGNTAMIYHDDEILAVVNGAAAGMLEAQSYQHILA